MLSPVFPGKLAVFALVENWNLKIDKPLVSCLSVIVLFAAMSQVMIKNSNRQKYFLLQQEIQKHEFLSRERDRLLLAKNRLLAQHSLSFAAKSKLNMSVPVKSVLVA